MQAGFAVWTQTLEWDAEMERTCMSRPSCQAAFREARIKDRGTQSPDTFAAFPLLVAEYHPQCGMMLCLECGKLLSNRLKEERLAIWRKLPVFFDIEVEDWSTE